MRESCIFLLILLSTAGMASGTLRADLNSDGQVDLEDLRVISDEWLCREDVISVESETWNSKYTGMFNRTVKWIEPIYAYDFSARANVIPYGSGVTLTFENSQFQSGAVAVKLANETINAISSAGIRYNLPHPIDITTLNFQLRYFVGFDSSEQKLYTSRFQLLFHSNNQFTSSYQSSIGVMPTQGWNIIENSCGQRADGALFDPTNVTSITLWLSSFRLPPNGYVIWDSFELWQSPHSKAAVMFTFDDAYENEYIKGICYLTKYEMPSVLYTSIERIGTPGFMTWDQLRAARDAKAMIATHSQYRMLNFLNTKTNAGRAAIAGISRCNSIVTVVTAADHNFTTGDLVLVGASEQRYNGFHTIRVIGKNSLTYNQYVGDDQGTGITGYVTPYTHDEIDKALAYWCWQQKKLLWDAGFKSDVDYMALPAGGCWNAGQVILRGPRDFQILRQFFTNIRGTMPYWNAIPGYQYDSYQGSTSPMPREPRASWWSWPASHAPKDEAALNACKAYVDNAITNRSVCIFYCHDIRDDGAGGVTLTACWEALVDYVAAKRNAGLLEVIDMREL